MPFFSKKTARVSNTERIMPESEPEKKTVPAGTPDASGADKRNNEPDKKTSGSSAAPKKKQPIPRRAKWTIALLILLCLILLGALLFLASDSLLFMVRFNKKLPFYRQHFNVMLTYTLAKLMIVMGFIFAN